jgi:rod shape-determining protein MreD
LNRVLGAALMVGAAVAQVTWATHLEVGGAYPNLVLLAIVALAWSRGARAAMAWACVGGLLLDLTAPGPIGPHALALVAVAYLTGFWSRNLGRQGVAYVAVSAVVGTVVYSAVLVLVDVAVGGPVPDLTAILQGAIAACIYNAALMPFAWAVARRLPAAAGGKLQLF